MVGIMSVLSYQIQKNKANIMESLSVLLRNTYLGLVKSALGLRFCFLLIEWPRAIPSSLYVVISSYVKW